MKLTCSQIALTWYPGVPPATDNPLELLTTNDYTVSGSPLDGLQEQLVDSASFIQGTTSDNFSKGNNQTRLRWETVRRQADPMRAQEDGLTAIAGLPTVDGWVKITLATRSTVWQVEKAAIQSAGYRHDEKQGLLYLSWVVTGGKLSVHTGEGVTVYPENEILLESATPTNRASFLLESADDPE